MTRIFHLKFVIQALYYTSVLMLRAMYIHQPDLLPNIAQWCLDYFDRNNVEKWVNESGGWVS